MEKQTGTDGVPCPKLLETAQIHYDRHPWIDTGIDYAMALTRASLPLAHDQLCYVYTDSS